MHSERYGVGIFYKSITISFNTKRPPFVDYNFYRLIVKDFS